jgi:DNA-binding transcriptional regulator YiaG
MPRRRPLRRPWPPKFTVPDDIDPRQVRADLGLSQERFAAFLGVSLRTVQAWERRHWIRLRPGEDSNNGSRWKHRYRQPSAAARVLLALVSCDPWVIADTLRDDDG